VACQNGKPSSNAPIFPLSRQPRGDENADSDDGEGVQKARFVRSRRRKSCFSGRLLIQINTQSTLRRNLKRSFRKIATIIRRNAGSRKLNKEKSS
jgi:hypothetical protein